MRLDKYLADCGFGSRKEIKQAIRAGTVRVADLLNPRPESQVDPQTAEVYAGGERVRYRRYIYLMLNKPGGCLSATWDRNKPVVLDLVPEEYLHYEPFPVGRLDLDTEGLCILTNDGQLAHRLLSPAKHIPKTYYAEVLGRVTEEDIRAFGRGLTLDDGYLTQPARLTILEAGKTSRTEVVITEGKFHQVKRMFESVGKTVIYLKRTAMNRLPLDESLELGGVRELTPEELELLSDEPCDTESGGRP